MFLCKQNKKRNKQKQIKKKNWDNDMEDMLLCLSFLKFKGLSFYFNFLHRFNLKF